MPRIGYKVITIPESLYRELEKEKRRRNLQSLPRLIADMLKPAKGFVTEEQVEEIVEGKIQQLRGY